MKRAVWAWQLIFGAYKSFEMYSSQRIIGKQPFGISPILNFGKLINFKWVTFVVQHAVVL